MRYFLSILLLMYLIIITSCATSHDKYLLAKPGWKKTDVVQKFGGPNEVIDDTEYTYWIYKTQVKPKGSKKWRDWQIRYAFQGDVLMDVQPEMIPTPDEIKLIEEKARENQRDKDYNFKEL